MPQPGKFALALLLLFAFGFSTANGLAPIRTGIPIPASIHTDPGRIIFSAEFNDKHGRNIVYASRYAPYQYGASGYEDAIWVKQYLFEKGEWKLKWQIRDYAPNALSSLSFDDRSFTVFDLDDDGVAETEFFYQIDFEGGDPSVLKYILHHNDVKLAIRGTLPVSAEMEEYTKRIDPAFDRADSSLKKYASARWDTFVNMYMKKYMRNPD